jgi:hypothetical protein
MLEGKRRAIIVGLNEVKASDMKLLGCENDAKELYDLLLNPNVGNFDGANSVLLVGRYASFNKIRNALEDAFSGNDVFDLAIFYFSGHGTVDSNGEGYIVPYDAIFENGDTKNAIKMSELNNIILDSTTIPNIVVILDCPNSGIAVEDYVNKIENKSLKTRYIIASSGARDFSAEGLYTHRGEKTGNPHTHGNLTFHLIEGLRGRASDENGIINLDGIWKYIETRLSKDLKATSRPMLGTTSVGQMKDIAFAVNASKYSRYFKTAQRNLSYGPSTHIATDKWTISDELGYLDYAHAIARFLTHNETRPPLSISIQAPWGGGKSSIMRMVQQELDPEALKLDKNPTIEPHNRIAVKKLLEILKEVETQNSEQANQNSEQLNRFKINKIKNEQEQHVKPRLTIWFNAWKYENSDQVWAGLADSITNQVIKRLKPEDRELFLFQLHMRRQNMDVIRREVYDDILTTWWQRTRPWVLSSVAGIGIAATISFLTWIGGSPWGMTGGIVGGIFSALLGSVQAIKQRMDIHNGPAEVVVGKYVDIPDYSNKLGFVHLVEADINKILDTIPREPKGYYRPIIIFVDDLDRCSPEKVTTVIEAINLFLAGEFEDCIFILGIDMEMVSAALEEAHSKVISRLPPYSKQTPIGWRFMDKFVQLPIMIPPPENDDIHSYIESLLSRDVSEYSYDATTNQPVPYKDKYSPMQPSDARPEKETPSNNGKKEAKVMSRIQKLDDSIDKYSDRDPNIRKMMSEAASSFSTNPRDLKRFMNAFRFYYFLKLARVNRKLPVPSDLQLTRWIILSLKYPDLVRWLQWRPYVVKTVTESGDPITTNERLKKLENLGRKCTTQNEWKTGIEKELLLNADSVSWVNDEGLREFFHEEGNKNPVKDRLSASVKNGFY